MLQLPVLEVRADVLEHARKVRPSQLAVGRRGKAAGQRLEGHLSGRGGVIYSLSSKGLSRLPCRGKAAPCFKQCQRLGDSDR